MQPSPMHSCPRCNTPLPANARFCRNCGFTLTPAQGGVQPAAPFPDTYSLAYPANQQAGAGSSVPWPPPDDHYIPNTPVSNASWSSPPQGGRYPAAYDEPEPPKRSFWRSLWGIVLIGTLLLTLVGVSLFAIYAYPTLCSVQARKGLRQDMPLPCGITFQDYIDRSASGTTGQGSTEWVFSVENTSGAQIKAFYQEHLPRNGWDLPPNAQNTEQFPDSILACKGDTLAIVHSTTQETLDAPGLSPPPGSVLLLIIFVPIKNLSENFCSTS
jgi:hypothetical protein